MISAFAFAESLRTDVETFSMQYAVYFNFLSPGRNNIALNIYQDEDIALHINPRYEFKCPITAQNILVLNNLIAGKWKSEERPEGFPFIPNEHTSIIVTPQESAYHIVARAADTTFTYDFSYKNEHKPSQVTSVAGISGDSACPPVLPFEPYVLSIGYHISTYSIASVIRVHAIAPSTGDVAIDIILGVPEDKEDLPVVLKVKIYFDDDPQILLLSDIEGVLADEQILSNPITADSPFIFKIALMPEGYYLIVNGTYLATFNHVVPLPSTPGPATIWVTGVTTLQKIEVC